MLRSQVDPYRVACPNHIDDVPGVDPDQFPSDWGDEEGEEGEGGGPGGGYAAHDLLRQ